MNTNKEHFGVCCLCMMSENVLWIHAGCSVFKCAGIHLFFLVTNDWNGDVLFIVSSGRDSNSEHWHIKTSLMLGNSLKDSDKNFSTGDNQISRKRQMTMNPSTFDGAFHRINFNSRCFSGPFVFRQIGFAFTTVAKVNASEKRLRNPTAQTKVQTCKKYARMYTETQSAEKKFTSWGLLAKREELDELAWSNRWNCCNRHTSHNPGRLTQTDATQLSSRSQVIFTE